MAVIQNPRDALLQSAANRFTAPGIPVDQVDGLPEVIEAVKGIRIEANGSQFVGTGEGYDPASITMTARLVGLSGTVQWAVVEGSATLTGSGNSRTVMAESVSGNRVRIRASVSQGSALYVAEHTIVRLGVDYYLAILANQIGSSQLTQELGKRIDLIDADESVPNSVAARLAAEAQARADALLDVAQGIANEATARNEQYGELAGSVLAETQARMQAMQELAWQLEIWGDEIGDVEQRSAALVAAAEARQIADLMREQAARIAQYEQVADGLAQEVQDRAAAVQGVRSQLGARIDALNAQVAEILGITAYSPTRPYALGELVTFEGKIYRALQASTGNAPTNEAYWELVGNYASIGEVIGDLSGRVTEVETVVAGQATRLTAVEARSEDAGSAITQLEQVQGQQATSLQQISTTVGQHASSISNLQQTTGDNATTLQAQETRIGEVEAGVSTLTQTAEGLATRLETVETSSGEQASSIQALQEASLDYALQLVELRSSIGENEGVITEIREVSATQARTMQRLLIRSGDIESSITEVQLVQADQAGRMTTLETRSDGAQSRIVDLEETTASTATRVSEMETEVDGHTARIQTVEQTAENLAGRVDTIEVTAGEQGSRIEQIETATADYAVRMSGLETESADQASRIQSVETTTADTATRVGTLETTAGEQGSKITQIEQTAEGQASRIGTLETASGEHTSKIGSLEETTEDHATRLETVEVESGENATSIVQLAQSDLQQALLLTAIMASDGDSDGVIAEQLEASARQARAIRTLSVTSDDAMAMLVAEQQARLDGDTALASDLLTLRNTVTNPRTGLAAMSQALSELSSTVSNPDNGLPSKASSQDLTLLRNQIEDPNTGLASKASSVAFEALSSSVTDSETGLEATASRVTQLQASVGDDIAAISEEMIVTADALEHLSAQYTFKMEVGGVVGGLVLTGKSDGQQGATIDFAIRANQFSIAPPAGSSLSTVNPFAVQTTAQTINGVTVPAGVYMDAAYINNVQALWARFGTLIADTIKATNIDAARITSGTINVNRLSSAVLTTTNFYSVNISASQITTGNFTANRISGGTLSGVTINIGSGAFEVYSNGYTSIDNLVTGRTQMTNSSSSGSSYTLIVQGFGGNTGGVAIDAQSASASVNAHAIRARNTNKGTSGLVGGANGYAFYAESGAANYGPFTGAHDAIMHSEDEIDLGDIVVDTRCVEARDISNTLFEVERSSRASERGALGVLAAVMGELSGSAPAALIGASRIYEVEVDGEREPMQQTDHIMTGSYYECAHSHKLVIVNAVGEGQINVCGRGGNMEAGDLIVCSDMPGKGMRQADDLVRSYTVAKVRTAVTFDHPDEVKLVPCIYLCG